MALKLADRLLTIVATTTIVSGAWILFGSLWLGMDPSLVRTGTEKPDARESAVRAEDDLELQSGFAPSASLMIPVVGVSANELTNTYGDERGGDDDARQHEAIDIMAPEGTAVVAAAPGTVERLFRSDEGGNTIYLRSDDRRTIQYYAHLAGYARGLEEGQRVRRGERLGAVGHTGNADPAAPHLHFALFRTTPQARWHEATTPLNPFPLLTGE